MIEKPPSNATEQPTNENELEQLPNELNTDKYLVETVESRQHEQLRATGTELFPGMEADRAEATIKQALDAVQHTASALTGEAIATCEERWSAMQQEEEHEIESAIPDDILVGYISLRGDGFSEAEIRELMDAGRAGKAEAMILARVQNEKSESDEWLTQSAERISAMEAGIEAYIEQTGVPYPAKEKAPIVGLGKYQGMLIASAESGTVGAFEAGGRYMAETGAVYLKHKPEDATEQGQLDDARMHLLTHERLHSLSSTNVPESTERVLEGEHTPGFQVGFTTVLEGDSSLSYGNINEATTEYFARKVSEELGYIERPTGMYDEEVASIELLLAHLGDSDKTTKELLEQYTSADGLSALNKAVEDRVGPSGLTLCNALFTRPHLLEQFLQHNKTSIENASEERMEMDVDVLQNASPPLDPLAAANDYPFLKLMTHVRDQETSEWKRVEYEPDTSVQERRVVTSEPESAEIEPVYHAEVPHGWTTLKHGTNLSNWGDVNPYTSDRIELTRPLSVISQEDYERDKEHGEQYDTTRTYSRSRKPTDMSEEDFARHDKSFEIRVLFYQDHVRHKYDEEYASTLDEKTKQQISKYYFANVQGGRHPLIPKGETLVKLGQIQEDGKDVFYFVPESLADEYEKENVGDDQTHTVRSENVNGLESNDSLLLFERLNNPHIFEQIVKTTMAGYKARAESGEPETKVRYKENGEMELYEVPYIQPTEEEVRRQIIENIEQVKSFTPVSFDDATPSASNIGVFWRFPDGSKPTMEQKSITLAHEKGHVVRQFHGGEAGDKYYEKMFGNAFDVERISYTQEEYENDVAAKRKEHAKNQERFKEDGIDALDLNENDLTYDKMKEGVINYLSEPAELVERMAQLKNYLGFRGDEEFTKEHLDYVRAHYVEETGMDNNMRQFFEAIKDDREFLNLINSVGV